MSRTAAKSAWVLLAAAIGLTASAPTSAPAGAASKILYHAAGKPAEQVLKELGPIIGVRFGATDPIRRQRLTLFLAGVAADELERWLPELLSVRHEARVSWVKSKDGEKVLTASPKWIELGEQLREEEFRAYAEFLASEVAWLGGDGAAMSERFLKGDRDPEVPDQRVRHALMLRSLGEFGRKRLLAGEAVVFRVAEVADDVSVALERVLPRSDIGRNAPIPKRFDRRCCVWQLERIPGQVGGFGIVETVFPGGGGISRNGQVLKRPRISGLHLLSYAQRPLRLPPADPADLSRRISVNLSPVPGTAPRSVERTLDQILARLGTETGINIVSDGYLRQRVYLPPNLVLRNYPLSQLLSRLSSAWDFDWRFVDGGEKTVLIRSRGWYLEDEVDVPEAVLERIRAVLAQPEKVDLSFLTELADLPSAQLRKLELSGALPGSLSFSEVVQFDNTGLRPLVRLYARLDAASRQRAEGPGGLPLKDIPPDLVKQHLSNTLIAYFADSTPEALSRISLHYEKKAPAQHRFALAAENGRGMLLDKVFSVAAPREVGLGQR